MVPVSVSADTLQFPAFATIERWIEISGVSRSTTYELLGSGDLVARKVGKRTLIDVGHGLTYLRSCPAATIRAPKPKA